MFLLHMNSLFLDLVRSCHLKIRLNITSTNINLNGQYFFQMVEYAKLPRTVLDVMSNYLNNFNVINCKKINSA